jgi:Holliday junction resolvase
MSMKSKGINAERELLHKFWQTGEWIALRSPGSGAIRYPCPDLLAGKQGRKLAIECKSTKADRQYLRQEQVADLRRFADIFGAEPWIAVRFDRDDWYFFMLEDIKETEGSNYVISKAMTATRGVLFDELVNGVGRG